MRFRREAFATGALAGVLVLWMASQAWACIATTGASLEEPSPSRAAVGVQVGVSGSGWDRGSQVDVFWSGDGAAVTEPALARVTSNDRGAISAWVTVPQADPGTHYIVARQGTTVKTVAFDVSPSDGASATNAPGTGGQLAPSSPSDQAVTSGATSGASQGSQAAPILSSTTVVDTGAVADTVGNGELPRPASVSRSASVIADSPTATPAIAAAENATPAAGSTAVLTPSNSVVWNDLWSGSAAEGPPAFSDLHGKTAAREGVPSGVGLLTGGLVALALGFGLREVVEHVGVARSGNQD